MDTQGFVLKVKVLAANTADQEGAKQLLAGIQPQFPRLQHLWVEVGYHSTFVSWAKEHLGWTVQRVQHPNAGSRRRIVAPGVEPAPIDRRFKGISRRWVVERTYGWLGRYRRLSKDYEFLPETSEASIHTTSLRTLLRRLAQSATSQTSSYYVQITVSDTGIGIRLELLPSVFEHFTQVEVPIRHTLSGVGLGLAIAPHLVKLHQGPIEVVSEGEGRGTTIIVKLPFNQPAQPAQLDTEMKLRERSVLCSIQILKPSP